MNSKSKKCSFRSVVKSVDSVEFPFRGDLAGQSSESLRIRGVRDGKMKLQYIQYGKSALINDSWQGCKARIRSCLKGISASLMLRNQTSPGQSVPSNLLTITFIYSVRNTCAYRDRGKEGRLASYWLPDPASLLVITFPAAVADSGFVSSILSVYRFSGH